MDDQQIKSEISEIWNTGADAYDTFVPHGIQTDQERDLWITALAKCLPPGKGPFRVLDVGCGTGAMGLILAEMGHCVTGIDLSEMMMEQGRRKAAERNVSMAFLYGDAEDPPFPDDHFDVVVNRHLLWTLPHPERAMQSWRRIVRPGGRVIVISGLWNDSGFVGQLRRAISQYLGRILDSKKTETLEYSAQLQTTLPCIGGVSEERAKILFAEADFDAIFSEDLTHIRRDQRSRLVWHQKIKPQGTYYVICGKKG